ncbi:MAG: hypothetical protein JEZ11_03565 [Desulfobacterales bacterium]|nr:hypothetical protein [Desulfobacterales bacterium]
MIALLNARFAFRLREADVSLRLVIDWFENQVGDKGWNAGFNLAYPNIPSLGYMGFINTDFYLCAKPTVSEKRSQLLPKTICVMGRGMIGALGEFCPGLNVETAPAFRFSHLQNAPQQPTTDNGSHFNVLVALPFSKRDSLRIMTLVGVAAEKLPGKVTFCLKKHPTAPETAMPQTADGKSKFSWVDGEFNDLLEKTDLLISTASSVCMESIVTGTPVIVVGDPSGLTLHPIPDSVAPGLWRLIYGPDDFIAAITFYKDRTAEAIRHHQVQGKMIRSEYFSPVTKGRVRAFLRL